MVGQGAKKRNLTGKARRFRGELINRNWADILRVAATMAAGTMRPSQILRKLAAYPRQNEMAAALREVGRIERSLFMIDWTTDPDMRRRTPRSA